MIHMYYDNFVELVVFIIDNYNKDIDFINKHAKQFLENTITLEPVIIPPIDLATYAPKRIKFTKIDVSN